MRGKELMSPPINIDMYNGGIVALVMEPPDQFLTFICQQQVDTFKVWSFIILLFSIKQSGKNRRLELI